MLIAQPTHAATMHSTNRSSGGSSRGKRGKRARADEAEAIAPTASMAPRTAASSIVAHPPLETRIIHPPRAQSEPDRSVRQRTSAPAFAQARLSPEDHFLRAFGRDQDSWFQLLHTKLNLSDIAVLHQVCHTTRRWIEQPSRLMLASKRTRVVSPLQLRLLSEHNCQWVLPFLMQIKINLRPTVPGVSASATPPPLAAPFVSIIEHLTRFPQLSRLGIQLCSIDAGRDEMKALFSRIQHIQHLDLLMAGVAEPAAVAAAAAPKGSAAAAAFLELGVLQNLESFSVSNLDELPSTLSFEALPTLPKLKQFSVTLSRGPASSGSSQRSFHCSAAQSKLLGQCKQLMHLRCGVWSQPAAMEDPVRSKMIIDAGVGNLIGAKIASLREAKKQLAEQVEQGAKAGRPVALHNLTPSAQPFQLLTLDGTVMSSAVWDQISQMHSLVTLTPYAWRSDIPRAKWARLATFKNLRSFSLMTHPADVYSEHPILSEDVLPPLMSCSMLQTMHLQSVSISTAQLEEIVKRLPYLKHLSLRALHVESLAPLANAKRLSVLSLHYCTQSVTTAGVHPSLACRDSIPVMPQLTSLLIFDRVRISAVTVASSNASLASRLPNLKPTAFHQNLLAELPRSEDDAASSDAAMRAQPSPPPEEPQQAVSNTPPAAATAAAAAVASYAAHPPTTAAAGAPMEGIT